MSTNVRYPIEKTIECFFCRSIVKPIILSHEYTRKPKDGQDNTFFIYHTYNIKCPNCGIILKTYGSKDIIHIDLKNSPHYESLT